MPHSPKPGPVFRASFLLSGDPHEAHYLDLETLGTASSTVVIFSIGAVAFDPYTTALGDKFYVELTDDIAAQRARGRTISGDTVPLVDAARRVGHPKCLPTPRWTACSARQHVRGAIPLQPLRHHQWCSGCRAVGQRRGLRQHHPRQPVRRVRDSQAVVPQPQTAATVP